MALTVNVYNKQKYLKINANRVKKLVKAVLQLEGISCDEISIHFVDEKEICDLHLQFFDDPSPTDCITFPLDRPSEDNFCFLGEVFINPKAAIDYVSNSDIPVLEEVSLYIIHGILHLLGYDDIELKDRRKMRLAEKKHLANMHEKKI